MGCQSESRLTNNNYNIERKELRQTIQNNRANEMSSITSTAKNKQTTIQFGFKFVLFIVVSHSLRVQSTDLVRFSHSPKTVQSSSQPKKKGNSKLRSGFYCGSPQHKSNQEIKTQNSTVCIHSSNTGIIYNMYTGYSRWISQSVVSQSVVSRQSTVGDSASA